MRTPSMIARDKGPYGNDAVHGQEQARTAKTPSEIAREKAPAEPQNGQEQGQERGNVHVRGRE